MSSTALISAAIAALTVVLGAAIADHLHEKARRRKGRR